MTTLHLYSIEHGGIPFGHGYFHRSNVPNGFHASTKMTQHVGKPTQTNHNMKQRALLIQYACHCEHNRNVGALPRRLKCSKGAAKNTTTCSGNEIAAALSRSGDLRQARLGLYRKLRPLWPFRPVSRPNTPSRHRPHLWHAECHRSTGPFPPTPAYRGSSAR